MPKILDSKTITEACYKIIETDSNYVLNCQNYSKDDFNPVPFNTMPIAVNGKCISLNKANSHNIGPNYAPCSWGNNDTDRMLIDNNDSDVCYIVTRSTDYNFVIRKIRNINGNVENEVSGLVSTPTFAGSAYISETYNDFAGWLGQDDDKVYFLDNGMHSYYYSSATRYRYPYTRVRAFNKSTGAITDPVALQGNGTRDDSNASQGGIVVGPKEAGFIYHTHSTTAYLYKFQAPNVIKTICTWSIASTEKAIPDVQLNADGSGDVIYLSNDGYFYQVKFDSSYQVTESNKLNLTIDASETLTLPQKTQLLLKLNRFEAQGNTYMSTVSFSARFTVHNPIIQVFLINSSGELIHQSTSTVSGVGCTKNYITSEDGRTMMFGHQGQFISIWQFSVLDGKFIRTNTLDNPYWSYGFDKDENIFVYEQTGELQMYNLKTAASLELVFEDATYEYAGTNVETNLLLSAKNFSGSLIEVNVNLVIKGPMTFTENSAKELNVTTLANEALQIPVTISGAGNISIYPRVTLT